MTIESRDELPKLEIIKSKILDEESRRVERQTEECSSNAFGVKSQTKRPYKDKKCNFCHKKGHVIAECRKLKSLKQPTNTKKEEQGFSLILDSGATSQMCC